ncbi:MAG: xanthine dehydrogenase accessory protein XdhC [Gammaproteobacteria bacterium]|nr:xanthine dehydrogenase accessory protein XdhC [Gammaproteobacteria bacterium]
MLVSANRISNTIGGGHLEYKAIQLARNMLSNDQSNKIHNFTLGAGLGQCCGGIVNLFFEMVDDKSHWVEEVSQLIIQQQNFVQVIPLVHHQDCPRLIVSQSSVKPDCSEDNRVVNIARTMLEKSQIASIKKIDDMEYVFDPIISSDFTLFLFGAGHVGEALIKQLAEQPCVVNWVDTRDDQLPASTPANVTAINTDIPEAIIDEAPAGSYFLVMTHDHSLDLKLSEQILKRDDFIYFGLIGSVTKRRKFEHRLLSRGISEKQLIKMTCPVGISGINSKRPAAIALAVTAELVQCHEQTMNRQYSYIGQSKYKKSIKL